MEICVTDKALYDLFEPGVRAAGFELVTVELTGRDNSSLLRVYIDGPDGITVDDCAAVSDRISAILDVEDPIRDRYTLEVSSPGFDRPLCKRSHFQAVVGDRIKLEAVGVVPGRKRFSGTLSAVVDDTIVMDIDGETFRIPLDTIGRARLVPDYKAGQAVEELN